MGVAAGISPSPDLPESTSAMRSRKNLVARTRGIAAYLGSTVGARSALISGLCSLPSDFEELQLYIWFWQCWHNMVNNWYIFLYLISLSKLILTLATQYRALRPFPFFNKNFFTPPSLYPSETFLHFSRVPLIFPSRFPPLFLFVSFAHHMCPKIEGRERERKKDDHGNNNHHLFISFVLLFARSLWIRHFLSGIFSFAWG